MSIRSAEQNPVNSFQFSAPCAMTVLISSLQECVIVKFKSFYSPYNNPHKRRHDAGKPFKAENHHKFKKMAPKMAVKVEKANNSLDVKVEVKEERV